MSVCPFFRTCVHAIAVQIDPGNIHAAINDLQKNDIRMSSVGMGAEVRVFRIACEVCLEATLISVWRETQRLRGGRVAW